MKLIVALASSLLMMTACQNSAAMAEQTPTQDPGVSVCMPKPGEGARWLAACDGAAKAGDGNAAIVTGEIYWNGDGVSKDNAAAARYWKMADQAGQPEAAKLLGDEAYVRALQINGACPVNPPALEEGVTWYRKAIQVERNPALRQQAQERLDQFLKLKSLWPHTCDSK